jgi:hypothetical protein
MKLLYKLLLLLLSFPCIAQDSIDYTSMIEPFVYTWHDQCINKLSTQEIIIIADMLLLSYQVVQASVVMSQSRLIMQEELLNIVTLSINDTFDARMQAQNNDLTKIKNAITDIEQAQEKIKSACDALKGFGPILIKIDPTVIQIFIANFKNVILNWAKYQQPTISQFEEIQEEFSNTADLFAQVKNMFQVIINTDPIDHSQLLHGTNSLTNMYNTIENMLGHLTHIRQTSLAEFNAILTLYFKNHYQVLYNHLQGINALDLKLIATQNHTLPNPNMIFA